MIRLDPSWRRVHMVGLGGAGMSAIARVLTEAGVSVSGSDLRESAALSRLRALGVRAEVGHRPGQGAGADVLVVSNAVGAGNPEVEEARAAGVPVLPRAEVLARLVRACRTIAVSGTHGKTTTSGMVATVLAYAGLDPTWLLGSDIEGLGSGGHLGRGDLAVVEADEAYGSFLHLEPAVALVTNVDEDHLDHYEGCDALHQAFATFMARASERVIVCADHPRAMQLAEPFDPVTYGLHPDASVRGSGLELEAGASAFRLVIDGSDAGAARLAVAGRHNVQNALGAAAACLAVGVAPREVLAGLEAFRGVSRRFELRGVFAGADLVDDYAHHPAEIEATLSAARWGPWRRVVAVFQPHLYSRTQALWRDFGIALASADVVVVTDVYGAREDPVPGVTGKLIVESVCEAAPGKKVGYLPRLNEAARYLRGEVRDGDLLLTLGAGDITTLHDRLLGDPEADW